ncbi:hypothetical protein NP233_g3428 [Leucocoprinus birnbaumii]|uniref:3,4-dihydroxy-2-butanone-4-phosphate synthase n=1 Tax=Leucocoprinus birnbaumii TaxID=56174 RepID=A0AAD5VWK6_9AGAR|nr:hypothetical protein NP233_g3428 [Leucocoprinus birnbaumii]
MRDLLSQLRRDTRAALLTSKKAIDSRNARAAREELFTSSAVKEKQPVNEKATDDLLMKANDDVTDALRRTIALMDGELRRSVLASQMLDESTATLRATSQTHDTLNSLMLTSKQLITTLEKADWLDRIIILSAFMFFVLVVLFILKQRFIDRGLRIALWWTRFIPLPDFRSKQRDVLKVAEEGSATLSTVVASVTSSLSTVVASISSSPSLVAVTTSSEIISTTSEDPIAISPNPAPFSPYPHVLKHSLNTTTASASTNGTSHTSSSTPAPQSTPSTQPWRPTLVDAPKRSTFAFDTVPEALEAFANGEFLVVMDDENRENEGDLIIAGGQCTTEKMAWMIKHTSGYICCAVPGSRLEELQIPMMVPDNQERHRTAYTVTVDYKHGTYRSSNPTQHPRITPESEAQQPVYPHTTAPSQSSHSPPRPPSQLTSLARDTWSPLRAREGGVLTRKGHTEAGVDLCLLTNQPQAGVLCELVNDDVMGTMARRDDCRAFADRWGLKMISVEMLEDYKRKVWLPQQQQQQQQNGGSIAQHQLILHTHLSERSEYNSKA